jgi:hypothetical protein
MLDLLCEESESRIRRSGKAHFDVITLHSTVKQEFCWIIRILAVEIDSWCSRIRNSSKLGIYGSKLIEKNRKIL